MLAGALASPTPQLIGFVVFGAMTLFFTALSATTLRWMIYGWSTPAKVQNRTTGDPTGQLDHSFSLLVCARDEADVLGSTLDGLAAQSHPRVEIVVVIGHDDHETLAVARAAQERHSDRIVVVEDRSVPPSKPASLNTGLARCTGDIVGVFDAEDDVAPTLLEAVDQGYQLSGADILQGGVQLMNVNSRWFTARNVLEYFFHFGSRLRLHAEQGFIPLGGNTVFIRRDLLVRNGGWDEACLAEDCELGIRLSVLGATTMAFYDPDLVTREEAPTEIGDFIRQRTRWDQGFLQVLRKGEWRALPQGSKRASARLMLAMPFIQALGILVAIGQIIFALMVDIPIGLAMLAFLPAAITLLTICIELAGLREFSKTFDIEVPFRTYVWIVVGFLPYHLMLGAAAARAMWREGRGEHGWEKTHHDGAHRRTTVDPDEQVIDLREPVLLRTGSSSDDDLDETLELADTTALAASDR